MKPFKFEYDTAISKSHWEVTMVASTYMQNIE